MRAVRIGTRLTAGRQVRLAMSSTVLLASVLDGPGDVSSVLVGVIGLRRSSSSSLKGLERV